MPASRVQILQLWCSPYVGILTAQVALLVPIWWIKQPVNPALQAVLNVIMPHLSHINLIVLQQQCMPMPNLQPLLQPLSSLMFAAGLQGTPRIAAKDLPPRTNCSSIYALTPPPCRNQCWVPRLLDFLPLIHFSSEHIQPHRLVHYQRLGIIRTANRPCYRHL